MTCFTSPCDDASSGALVATLQSSNPRICNDPKLAQLSKSIQGPCSNLGNLRLGLRLGGTAAHALSFRALKVGHRNPALVVGLCARCDGRAISTDDSDLIGGVDLLGLARGPLRALAALATALLLGEEGGDPSVVDEVADSTERTEDDQVKEDARGSQSATCLQAEWGSRGGVSG